jgi:hypothetical protein
MNISRSLVVAVDPGGTYGVARAIIGPSLHSVAASELSPLDALSFVECLLPDTEFLFVESFTPRSGVRTWQPEALEGIGALRYLAARYGTQFELQSPSDAKRFSTNKKLEALGWRTPTRGGHADDALRHLLLGAVRRGLLDPSTLV